MSIAVDTKVGTMPLRRCRRSYSFQDSRIVCGINSTEVELKKGQNQNCRAFSIKDNEYDIHYRLMSTY